MPEPYKEYKSWRIPALLLQVELIGSQAGGWERQAAEWEGLGAVQWGSPGLLVKLPTG